MDNSSTFQILLSMVGADAVTGAFDDITAKTGSAVGSLAQLAGAALSLNAAFSGIQDAFGLGAQFEQLSARTGQSVQDLAVLSRAFQTVGLSGDQIGLMANRLQRAMSGMSETGKSTTKAFADLGINAKQLSELSFNEQLTELAAGFSKIQSPAERAAIAMQIFGRAGGQMLQLLENSGLLAQAGIDAGGLAQRLEEDAQGFQSVSNQLSLLKTRFQEMFVVVAEQLLPALKSIGGAIGSLNLAPMGAALGTGGVMAFAGIFASAVTSKLDVAMGAWARSGAMGASIAAGLEPLTATLADIFTIALPAIIIGAIAMAIVAGVTEGMKDADNQADRTREAGAKTVHGDRAMMGSARDTADVTAARGKMQSDIEAAKKVIAELEAKQAEYDATNQAQAGVDAPSVLTLSDQELVQLETAKKTVADLQATLSRPVNTDSIFAANKIKDVNAALSEMSATAEQMQEKIDAIHLEQMAPADRLTMLQSKRSVQVGIMNAPTPGLTDDNAAKQKEAAELQIAEIDKQIDATNKQIVETQKQQTAEVKKQTDAADQLQIIKLEGQQEAAKASGDTAGAEKIKEQIDLIRYKKELTDLGVTDLSSAQQRVDAEHQLFETEQARAAAKKADDAAKKAMEGGVVSLTGQLDDVRGSTTLSSVEKYEQEKNLLQQIVNLKQQYLIQLQHERSEEAKDPKATPDLKDGAIDEAEKSLNTTNKQLTQLGPSPLDFTAQWHTAMTKLRDEWTTTAQTAAQQMMSALTRIQTNLSSSLSSALTGLIEKTMTWKQAALSVGNSFLSSIINAFTEMVSQYLVKKAAMFAIDELFAAKGVLLSMASAAKSLIAWLPSAIAASISSYGLAAAIGMAAVIAVIASKGFASGGYTGDGADGELAGAVHRGEFVFSAPSVRNIGVERLAALHSSGITAFKSTSAPMGKTGGNGANRPERSIIYADHAQMRDRLMKDPAFTNHIATVGYRRRGQIGGL